MSDFNFIERIYNTKAKENDFDALTSIVERDVMQCIYELKIIERTGSTEDKMRGFVRSAVAKAVFELRHDDSEFETLSWKEKDKAIQERVIDDVLKFSELVALHNFK